MDTTKTKQNYMHWVRKFVRDLKADPYLQPRGVENLRIEMVRWDKRNNAGLFVVYDRRVGKTEWNTDLCRWDWIRFSDWGKRNMWRMVNDVLCEMRMAQVKNVD